MTRPSPVALEQAMERLAGGAKRTGRSVRGVARWGHNTTCTLNNAMFAARVDGDRLLAGTSYEADFGQSPFAIARGERVERIGRANGYEVTFGLLQASFGFSIPEAIPLDLRSGFPRNGQGLAQRAT